MELTVQVAVALVAASDGGMSCQRTAGGLPGRGGQRRQRDIVLQPVQLLHLLRVRPRYPGADALPAGHQVQRRVEDLRPSGRRQLLRAPAAHRGARDGSSARGPAAHREDHHYQDDGGDHQAR
uniref:Salivary protein n=1 Tax=Ixodes scapularis TaxID=6945 RepID=Q4PM72_IXOSC|nr:salivary protein [Ixodes scapularis]